MNESGKKNLPASVHQLLLNEAKKTGKTFNELFQYFTMERFLYRLSKSPFQDGFILKGALMLYVWKMAVSRSTLDIDLLGRSPADIDSIVSVIKKICRKKVEPDGITFDSESISGVAIKENMRYPGVRVSFEGSLGNARVNMQIDIGFGDIVVPKPAKVKYPAILSFPEPIIHVYSPETVVSEKFEAMVKLGRFNSRIKDFYDIWLLSQNLEFSGTRLGKAISKTFSNRKTLLPEDLKQFLDEITKGPIKESQWQGFVKKYRRDEVSTSFPEVVKALTLFLGPISQALSSGSTFKGSWSAGGPWFPLNE